MFDDPDLPKPRNHDFPRNLDGLSVSELEDYIGDLEGEIARVKEDIARKKASQDAAASIFKSQD